MSVSIDSMKDKLLTVDETMEKLSEFEPFGSVPITKESTVHFTVDPLWALNVDTLGDTELVDVTVDIDGSEHRLTKEAFNQLAVNVGLPAATVKKVPSDAVEGFLNRLYRKPEHESKIITVDGNVAALTRSTIVPFSNVRLAEAVVDSIRHSYGTDAEIYVDYKFQNTLTKTDMRFIIPQESRRMKDTYMTDVPQGAYDDWSAGVHLSNSLIGKSQTFVDSYLFRWWCTNGATTTNSKVGAWDRRRNGNDPEDVLDWASSSVDSIIEAMEAQFNQVQSLAELVIPDAAAALSEVFSQWNLPARQRSRILATVAGTQHLTMYSLMQAVTEAANDPLLSARDVERLLRIGGVLQGDATLDPQKARIWDAGHFAPSGATNPFAIGNRD